MVDQLKLIECPRDAWQGLKKTIPVAEKVAYLRKLMEAGFRHIDAVSFVSPKHVPQMADSEEVMERLLAGYGGALPAAAGAPMEIIGIVVNEKGMERALATKGVTTLGYPYSISAYFRRANANMTREETRRVVEVLKEETGKAGQGLVVYISMAFGNPFEEPWGPEIVADTLEWLKEIQVRQVSLADTVGTATPKAVGELYGAVKDAVAGIELGVHLHSRPTDAAEKVMAAYEAGCRRFDGALTGLGGCPFAGDELVGNIPTEIVVRTLEEKGVRSGVEAKAMGEAMRMSEEIRGRYTHE